MFYVTGYTIIRKRGTIVLLGRSVTSINRILQVFYIPRPRNIMLVMEAKTAENSNAHRTHYQERASHPSRNGVNTSPRF